MCSVSSFPRVSIPKYRVKEDRIFLRNGWGSGPQEVLCHLGAQKNLEPGILRMLYLPTTCFGVLTDRIKQGDDKTL